MDIIVPADFACLTLFVYRDTEIECASLSLAVHVFNRIISMVCER